MSVGAGAGYWIVWDDRGLRIMSGLSAAVSLLIPGERRDYTRRERYQSQPATFTRSSCRDRDMVAWPPVPAHHQF